MISYHDPQTAAIHFSRVRPHFQQKRTTFTQHERQNNRRSLSLVFCRCECTSFSPIRIRLPLESQTVRLQQLESISLKMARTNHNPFQHHRIHSADSGQTADEYECNFALCVL